MSTTIAVHHPAEEKARRDKEVQFAALAEELFNDTNESYLRIDGANTAFLVRRYSPPVLLDAWPSHLSTERIAELERRLANADDAEVLFEFTLPDDEVSPVPLQESRFESPQDISGRP